MNILRLIVLTMAMFATGCQSLATTEGLHSRQAAVANLEPGSSKTAVRAALGNPDSIDLYTRLNEEVWRYLGLLAGDDEVWVTFAPDGTVSEVHRVPYVEPNFGIFAD